jgi:uncharacterized membrane protein
MWYVIIILLLYFVPAITAYENKKKNKQSVLVINLFLGWSIIGWIVALAMAVGKDKETVIKKDVSVNTTTDELEKLVKLKDKGALTQEEFEKQKQKILS